MKKIKFVIIVFAIIVIAPILSGCSLFNVDTDAMLKEIESSITYDGKYIVKSYFENNQSKPITSSLQECKYVFEIKDSTLNVIDNDVAIETYTIEPCTCGTIIIKERDDVFAKIDDSGFLHFTKVTTAKTMRVICESTNEAAPTDILGTYTYSSFKRNEHQISTVPNNSDYPDEIDYNSQAKLSFEICDDNNLKVYNEGVLIKTQTFFVTNTGLILSKDYRINSTSGSISIYTYVSESLEYKFTYRKA